MSAIIPFSSEKALAVASRFAKFAHINDEVVSSRGEYPVISIKGGKFTIVRDGNRQVLTKPDDEDEVAQYIQAVIVRANTHARQFYEVAYVEGESEGNKPTCYSDDGVAPAADVASPCAKKCALCPNAVWGSGKGGKGSLCKSNIRIAVATPDKLEEPYLIRVPPASFSDKEAKNGIKDLFSIVKARGLPYNAVLVKIGFDREAPSPKLTFKPIGVLDDASYEVVAEQYETELVKQIVGAVPAPVREESTKKDDIADELDAALEARKAAKKAAESAKEEVAPPKKAKPVVEDDGDEYVPPKAKKSKPVVEDDEDEAPKPKKAKPVVDGDEDLLASLDGILGSTDD